MFNHRRAQIELMEKMSQTLESTQQSNQLLAESVAKAQENNRLITAMICDTAKSSNAQLSKQQEPPIEKAHSGEFDEIARMKAAYALNLCTVSVSQIIQYNDLRFMEREYEAILNNLNLEEYPKDDALLQILKQILDVVSFFRIQEGDKAMLEKEYRLRMKNAIWSAVPNFGIIIGGGNPVMIALSLAAQIGTGYMNYRKEKAQISLEHDKEEWKLQRSAMEQLHGLQRELFDTAWRLADTYNFKDKYRLTERQLKRYNDILDDDDCIRRYERLISIKDYFEAYPPFWYYLGHAANEAYQTTNDNFYCKEATDYFEHYLDIFHEFNLLREDQLAASCALEYCDLISEKDPEKKDWCINLAMQYSGGALDVMQLCAIAYLKNNKTEKACTLLRELINEEYNVDVNAKILSRIYVQSIIDSKSHEAESQYRKLLDRAHDVSLYPLPDSVNNISDLQSSYIALLKNDLCGNCISAMEDIILRYEHRYKIICSSKTDRGVKIPELFRSLSTVMQEFLGYSDTTNTFTENLRMALNDNEEKLVELLGGKTPKDDISFYRICGDAFMSVCGDIVERITSANDIASISSLDVKLSEFCSKFSYRVAEPMPEAESSELSMADTILGVGFETQMRLMKLIDNCIKTVKNNADKIICNNSKYQFVIKGDNEYAIFIDDNRKWVNPDITFAVLKCFDPVVFTVDGIVFRKKKIMYKDISQLSLGVFECSYNSSGTTKTVNLKVDKTAIISDELNVLFKALARLTDSGEGKASTEDSEALINRINNEIRTLFEEQALKQDDITVTTVSWQ